MVKGLKTTSKSSTTNNRKKVVKKISKKDASKNNERKLIVFSFILVSLLILLGISLTYAYFSRYYSVEGEEPKTNVETGKLDVDFLTSEYINNKNAKLIDDGSAYTQAEKTHFSVTRSSLNTVEQVYYTLQLVDIKISNNLKSSYFKWRLYETTEIDADTEPLNYGDFKDINCDDDSVCTLDLYDTKIPLASTVTDDFVLLVWLSNEESKNQTELLNGDFSAKVQVTAVNN